MMNKREVPLIHPGEILLEEWLKPLGISQYALAKAIGKRGITADTALRLATYFGTDSQSWLNLQSHYDAEQTRVVIAESLAHIQPFATA